MTKRTSADSVTFVRILLNNSELNGRRILEPEMVELMAVFFVQKFPFDGRLHKVFRDAVYGPLLFRHCEEQSDDVAISKCSAL